MMRVPEQQVWRRRVFYVPGFDPMPARRYCELYRKEGTAQSKISGYRIKMQSGKGNKTFGWEVSAFMDGAEVETRIDVLVWSDLVRDSMEGSIPVTFGHLLRTI
jgi:hypothetical protein